MSRLDQRREFAFRAVELAFTEKNAALHVIRERAQRFTTWWSAGVLVATSWLLGMSVPVSHYGLVSANVVTLLSLMAVVQILRNEEAGFKSNQQALSRCEVALGLYEQGLVERIDEPLFPRKWMHSGKADERPSFFKTMFRFIWVAAIAAALGQGILWARLMAESQSTAVGP